MNNTTGIINLTTSMKDKYKLSRYNCRLTPEGNLLYNPSTPLQVVASFPNADVEEKDLPNLLECGFITEKGSDELARLKNEYDHRSEMLTDLHLIIATTLDCQFRCIYCYENHPNMLIRFHKIVSKYENNDLRKTYCLFSILAPDDFSTFKK